MKKIDYQAPKMVAVKLNRKPTLLQASCASECTGEGGGGGGECMFGG